MKTSFLVTLLLFILFGYAQPQSVLMSPQEQETAKKEVKEVVHEIFQSLEKMDIEGLSMSYLSSADYILFTTDGTMADYQTAKDHHAKWFKSLSSLKVTTIKEEFRFLSGNIAICPWLGTFDMMLKSGKQMKINFAITFVFSKIDDQWKVVYQQSSALPLAKEKPAN